MGHYSNECEDEATMKNPTKRV